MAGRQKDRDLYDLLVTAFREKPGNASHAARMAGCHARMAERTFRLGWPECKKFAWARPIKDVLADEDRTLRAQIEMERASAEETTAKEGQQIRDERELARRDVIAQKERELKANRASLQAGTAILGLASEMARALFPLIKLYRLKLENTTEKNFDVKDFHRLTKELAYIVFVATRTTGYAMDSERKRVAGMDEPTAQQASYLDEFDYDRAVSLLGSEAEIEAAVRELVDGKMTVRASKLIESIRPAMSSQPS